MSFEEKLRARRERGAGREGADGAAAAALRQSSSLQQHLAAAQERDRRVERALIRDAERSLAAAEAAEAERARRREAHERGRVHRAEERAHWALTSVTDDAVPTAQQQQQQQQQQQTARVSEEEPPRVKVLSTAATAHAIVSPSPAEASQIKGVCASPVALPGLFDGWSGAAAVDLTLRFPGSEALRAGDLARVAAELAEGVYLHGGAVPWLSIESVSDRRAARLATLHPCYRDTLVGLTCLELDVALKAIGGTALGGVFCNAADRDAFLNDVCFGGHQDAQRWGPNGQREFPPALAASGLKGGASSGQTMMSTLALIRGRYPSFATANDLFGSDEVHEWKAAWEAAWQGEASGADIRARLDDLVVYDASSSKLLRRASSSLPSFKTEEEVVSLTAEARASWRVEMHAEGGSAEARAVALRGEALGARLLPLIPIPKPRCGDWAPPPGADRLAYLFKLLEAAAALASALATAKEALPGLVPRDDDEAENDDHVEAPPCRTPRWLPFEPAVDRESKAVFLGGGVALGAATAGALKRRPGPAPPAPPHTPSFTLRLRRPPPLGGRDARRDADRPSYDDDADDDDDDESNEALFFHEVAALGLAANYASAHPEAKARFAFGGAVLPIGAGTLAGLLRDLLPDKFCRRLGKSRAAVARDVLLRPDVADQLAAEDTDELERPYKETVTFFNGDAYSGHWRCGRRHGAGIYTFASGSIFEGRWDEGKMVGVGWFTPLGGKRTLVDFRKGKGKSPC